MITQSPYFPGVDGVPTTVSAEDWRHRLLRRLRLLRHALLHVIGGLERQLDASNARSAGEDVVLGIAHLQVKPVATAAQRVSRVVRQIHADSLLHLLALDHVMGVP